MKKKRMIAAVLCLAMLFAFAGCTGAGETPPAGGTPAPADNNPGGDAPSGGASDEGPIYLGMIHSITGNFADFGVGNKWSAERAVAEINAAGGIAGRELILTFNDDEGDPTVATTLAQKVVDDERVLGLVGSFSTACSTVIAEIIDGKLCQISGSSSSTVYTDTSDWAFSIFGALATESQFMCRYVVKKYLGNPSVGLLYSDTDFSHSALDAFRAQAEKDGVNIVESISYNPSETDFSSIITKMQLKNPDTLVLIGTEGGTNVMNQVRSVGWDVQMCVYSKSANLLEQIGGNAEGLVLLSRFEFNMDDAFQAKFYNDFVAEFGFDPLLQSSSSYDAVYMYKQAIEELAAEGAPVTRQAIRDKITSITYDGGLTGPIVFDSHGMVERGCVIFRVENGAFVQETDYSYIDSGY
jgi:branched-chain amino acid transport system substrate-binding protein